MTATFQFIGSYDNRTMTGTIAASDAHAMATRTAKPRKPKSHSIEDIQKRCKHMGVTFEMQGTTIYLTPSDTSEYHTTNKKYAWQVLDCIQADILAKLSDDQVFERAAKSLELITA